ncbi:MAG: PrgI family protein [bacterium]|nr:PrgI family protein [bacterium]
MQFQVPQFLDVEDKIIGPFTIKQFLYITGGLGMGYLSYRFIPWVGFVIGILFGAFGAALAFYKYNNKPFIFLIESAFNYIRSDRFYLWKRREKAAELELNLNNFTLTKHKAGPAMKTVSSKLSDLSWSMNIEEPPESKEDERQLNELGL